MSEDIEIVEPTEAERRAILNTATPSVAQLTALQQGVVVMIEQCIRVVAELKPGTADSNVNPLMKHPYQRQAVHALELAHSECLNWFDRANRGFVWPSPTSIPDKPEPQE